jgi:hypothetical protein
MKAGKAATWLGELGKLPPSTVFANFADEGDAERRAHLETLVEFVEDARTLDPRGFVGHTSNPTEQGSRPQAQRTAALMAAYISLVEQGWEDEIGLYAADLLGRYRAARDEALANLKSARAILVALLQNADGAARGETLDERLDRSIEQAKTEAPIYLGTFAQYADQPDDE